MDTPEEQVVRDKGHSDKKVAFLNLVQKESTKSNPRIKHGKRVLTLEGRLMAAHLFTFGEYRDITNPVERINAVYDVLSDAGIETGTVGDVFQELFALDARVENRMKEVYIEEASGYPKISQRRFREGLAVGIFMTMWVMFGLILYFVAK